MGVGGSLGWKHIPVDLVSDELDIDGSRTSLISFFRLLDAVDPNFAIVTA